MRIAEVESLLLRGAHFVRITTEQGQVGLGQSACWAYPEAVFGKVAMWGGATIRHDDLWFPLGLVSGVLRTSSASGA